MPMLMSKVIEFFVLPIKAEDPAKRVTPGKANHHTAKHPIQTQLKEEEEEEI